ncbi:porphobilinogen synthase [Amedibacillus sp. YH-ame10]
MYRGRRLRKNEKIRSLIQETTLRKQDLILPIFVIEGTGIYHEIETLPEVYQYSIDKLHIICEQMIQAEIYSCILFGIPMHKDAFGSSAYDEHGVVQEAIRFMKKEYPSIYIIGDVCMCEYTDHGHCGILNENHEVDNDETLPYLNKIALSYAKAGIDMIAPSDMMDGHIATLRKALDEEGYQEVAIMGYSAKYASNFYGPFRAAANSTPCFGNRKGYQMDYANAREALREVEADIEEGADIIMVKPALAYLDIVATVKQRFSHPLAVYNVSGEYAMLKMAIANGLLAEDAIIESMLCMKRAGADIIITYFALYLANCIDEGRI